MFSPGPLLIGGFTGTSLPASFGRALRDRDRGGVIVFKRNLGGSIQETAHLFRQIHATSPLVPLVGIDQEGGRVARLGAPFLRVPSMRTVASWGDIELGQRIARTVGDELAALGVNLVFAPVLDVNSFAKSPVIGDRAFGDNAEICARWGVAWLRGLQGAGILACGKHFPGHGDAVADSHVQLPTVETHIDVLRARELAPFRAAVAANVSALMTAHVVYSALDARSPATLSPAACALLRTELGFAGLLVTDDLEMQAIAAHFSMEDAAIQAVAAGCDALLVCSSEDKQDQALQALRRESERSAAFRTRCEEALRRVEHTRCRVTARPLDDASIARVLQASLPVAQVIAQRTS